MLKKELFPVWMFVMGRWLKVFNFAITEVVGDILELAKRYSDAGADELVFYAITASSNAANNDRQWVKSC